jgi:glycolate oxidase iron-sulfur subunit
MQTAFSLAQLQDPHLAEANGILRSCVHCGFCTATCPTYVLLGDELDSPRGRISLIKEMLEQGTPATATIATHLDRCLSCFACMTTCPSGVDYMHLIDTGRAHLERTYTRPWRARALRWLLGAVLPHPARLRLALGLAALARPLAPLLPARLRTMLALVPRHTAAATVGPGTYPAVGIRRMRVALLTGCVQSVIEDNINAATIRLLTRHGVEVVVTQHAKCCGALNQHMGRLTPARTAAIQVIESWLAVADEGGLDAIVINTSGCGTMVKDYGHMFREDPELAVKAARVSALARDVSEVLAGLPLAYTADHKMRVAYHSACSLQHGQRITAAPVKLLQNAGFAVMLPAEGHLCCGSAGTYNILQPEIAGALRDRKVANLEALEPQVICAGNIGCMVQIRAGSRIPMVHTVELLDWATGGPKPARLAQ